ncbi:MAG: ABC transporter substrate-binding protein [Devosia sp.]
MIKTNGLRVLAASLMTATLLNATAAVAQDACAPGGTLRMARDQNTASVVPWDSLGNGPIFSQIQIYDRLVEQMPGTTDVQPGLAESWEIADAGLTYTFHIRQGVKFSNGDPVTIEDVKWNMDRMIDPEVQSGWSFLMPNIAGFETPDDKTLVMKMKQVDASVLYTLSLPAGGIASKKAFDTMGADAFAANPVGSGPFMVKANNVGTDLQLVKNPNYWKEGKPYFDAVTFELLADDNARMLKIQSGEADIAQSVPYAQAPTIDGLDGIGVKVEPYTVMDSIWLNNTAKPLDEKVVRQALNYATPKEVINDVIFNGLGTPQNHMISRLNFWDETVPFYPYDIDKAKELLGQSSVPNGFDLPMLVSAGDTLSQQTAEILQAEWAKIGVNVDIQTLDGAAVDDKYWSGDYMAKTWSPSAISSDIPDDSEQAFIMLDYSDAWKGFGTNYKSDEMSKLVKAAVGTTDTDKRRELYHQIQRLAMEDAPQVALVFAPTVTAVSDKIGNFQTLSSGWWRLEDICFKK